jgi:hypothetical protein
MEQPFIGVSHVRRIVTRPAIAEAVRACGFTDREIAHLMGIQSATMSAFMRGERPLPAFRHFALIMLVRVLLHGIGSPAMMPSTEHTARAQAMRHSVERWLEVAEAEFGTPSGEAGTMGHELLRRMLDQMELTEAP